MKNHCAFSKNHSCPLWTDYELTCYELEEANSLCHGNWIEIERQYKYIQTLQKILSDNDIPYPNEYDFDCNRQIMMRSDIKLPQPFASWSNSL